MNGKRWLIAIMGVLMQLCLGTVYAWSFFQKPIMKEFGWSNTQVIWIFSIAICFLGLSAAWGGIKLPKFGPRRLAVAGGLLYGAGWILSALAMKLHNLPLFYASFGIVGGCGLGLGYVTPVATAVKWFPEKKGFISGMVVMGFGLGALFMSKLLAPLFLSLTDNNLSLTFVCIGSAMLALIVFAGLFMKNPSAPGGPATAEAIPGLSGSDARASIFSVRFLVLWLIFFSNICAGMMFIGLQSPMLQDMLKTAGSALGPPGLAAAGATLIALSSLFNGIGRFLWGGVSDRIGRMPTFRMLLGSQIVIFIVLIFVKSPLVFGFLVCYVLLCYGGGFGTMPATVNTMFGGALMPVIYGFMLTAWSAGGIAGPQLAARIRDLYADRAPAITFAAGAAILCAGFVLSLLLSDKKSPLILQEGAMQAKPIK